MIQNLDPNPETTKLSNGTTVAEYRALVANRNRSKIAEMIQQRFTERYLDPVTERSSTAMHGFTMLAVCCLMVEALEAFCQGVDETPSPNRKAFQDFFNRYDDFAELRPLVRQFYKGVRCGILHQAETTKRWRVHKRPGALVSTHGQINWISAAEFARRMRNVLDEYCEKLKGDDWDSKVWRSARSKLKAVCKNCGATELKALS